MPPFFIPFLAFFLWAGALLLSLPVLRWGLSLSDQTTAALFFVSNLIVVVAWPLSGPVAAAILSVFSALASVYLCLGTREPAYLIQVPVYGALFFILAIYLVRVQRETNDGKIFREKLTEDAHLTRQATLEKKDLKKALEKKVRLFMNLEKFSEDLKNAPDVTAVARKIVGEAHEVLGKADQCVLYLVDEARQELSLAAAVAPEGDATAPRIGGSVFDQWVMKRSQAIMVNDAHEDFRFAADPRARSERIRSVCASPLITENKVLGVIRANAATPGCFTADDLRLMDIFSGVGAVTLRNRLLYETMDWLARHDSLTGLCLNRHFQEKLDEEIGRAGGTEGIFSIVLLDIDHFKGANDEYGHSAGDLILKNLAAIVKKSLGPADVAARYGGEEFIVLFPGKSKRAAGQAAEKIRQEVESSVFSLRRAQRRVTVSLGVASFPEAGRTREELIRQADRNLYEAKKSGRNRVCGGT